MAAPPANAKPPKRKDDEDDERNITTAPPTTLTIVTWNCNGIASGLGANVKYEPERTLGQWLRRRLGADVACLQETKLAAAKIPRELAAAVDGYESFWASSLDKTGYSGVVTYAASPLWSPVDARAPALLFSSSPASPASTAPPSDPLDREGRVVETDLGSGAFVLINVYAPNAGHGSRQRPVEGGGGGDRGDDDDEQAAAAAAGGGGGGGGGGGSNGSTGGAPALSRRAEKLRFLRRLTARARELHAAGRRVVLVGDLNVAVSDADVSPLIGGIGDVYSREERAAFEELLAELPDAWRALHPLPPPGGGGGGGGGAAAAGGGGGGGGGGADLPPPSARPAPSCFTVWDERTSARAFDRGLRIDYVLVSPSLLPLVVSAEILGKDAIPQKWSDHAALRVVLRAAAAPATAAASLAPPPPHAPCRASSLVKERWALRPKGQKSISSFFSAAAAKRPKEGGGGGGAGGAAGAGEPPPTKKQAK